MREILFKAKRIDNGEWVQGSLVVKKDTGNDTITCYIIRPSYVHFNNSHIVHVEVDPETLCEFTGLCDKNGKKIWENDLVKYGEYAGLVAYSAPEYICLFKDIEGLSYISLNSTEEDFEIIGNKFNNPVKRENTTVIRKFLTNGEK